MDLLYKYAAIDIGSNAVRLLLAGISHQNPDKPPKKISLVRMPIRLGEDVFVLGHISQDKAERLEKTLTGFKYLINAFEPMAVMTCATAAMRNAENKDIICGNIAEKTGIVIDILDGKQEAGILFRNRQSNLFSDDKASLFVDVGGGSTEMTLFDQGHIVASASFNIGTIRLLNNRVSPPLWEEMQQWVKENTVTHKTIEAIGSGGNINKLFRLVNGKAGQPVSYRRIRQISNRLKSMDVDQRITQFNLRPDRADVIVPASEIYLQVMKWSGCKKIHVPMMGLADGMVRILHEQHTAASETGN
ncbi:MAG: exopolyphosphatase [Pseudomonadota bacterium]